MARLARLYDSHGSHSIQTHRATLSAFSWIQKICTANKRSHYPLPTVDDVTSRLTKAKVFGVMDAKSAFWQVKLTESSSYYITFNTSFVRFRWLRMPFGISSAPEVWQRNMKEPIEGLRGVQVIAEFNRIPPKVPQIKPDTQSSKGQVVGHFVNC